MSDLLVLCYHAVSESWPAELSVTPEALEEQLAWLVHHGYRGACFTKALSGPVPNPTVVVSFDDGYRSVFTHAKPILDRYDIPGTLYVPTDWIEEQRPMNWKGIDHWQGGEHQDELRSLSWTQLRELSQAGWEIGSHTCTHSRLTELDDAELEHELGASKARIEEELESPCSSIAYPYGSVDARVQAAVRASGYLGAGALPRVLYLPLSLRWPRIPIYHGDSILRFRAKASPAIRRLRSINR